MQPVTEGYAFLASADEPFCYRHRGHSPWEFIYLTFTGSVGVSFFQRWREENGSIIKIQDPGKLILKTRQLQEDLKGMDVKDFRSNSRKAYEFLLLIDASIAKTEMVQSVRKQTEEMVKRNLTNISVDKLAALWGYEPHYFITWLRLNTGVTPGKLIREIQLESAAEYLIHSVRNITTIAEQCGFDDPGLFSRSFRKQFGCPPREYRKRKRAPILGEPVFLTDKEEEL
jgi:AraC-like DNA-binding protein